MGTCPCRRSEVFQTTCPTSPSPKELPSLWRHETRHCQHTDRKEPAVGKGKRLRAQRESSLPQSQVRGRVVIGDVDLSKAMELVRPALLYADEVTVHAPAASLLMTLGGLADIKHPVEQLDFILEMSRRHPDAVGQMDFSAEQLQALRQFLTLDRDLVRRVSPAGGGRQELDDFYEQIDGMGGLFEETFGRAMEQATAQVGADELLEAARAGLLAIEPLAEVDVHEALSGVVDAATGGTQRWDVGDSMVLAMMNTLVEVLTTGDGVPILDAGAAGLARALRSDGLLGAAPAGKRDLATAAGLMSHLPNLDDVAVSDIVRIRTKLRDPLTRFRSAVARMSKHFSGEIYDESMLAEVRAAWREDVEPALLEVREGLRDAGMLRTFRSVAMEAPGRLAAEAGGAFYIGHATTGSLSEQLVAALAAGVPIGDAALRAVHRSIEKSKAAKRNDFYFLHAVSGVQ